MPRVEYSSNNSGGSWWLKDEDWHALEGAGWDVEWIATRTSDDPMLERMYARDRGEGARWLGALAKEASKEFDNPRAAIEEFESITGQDASAEGCNCCGPPHSFSYTDDQGNYHYATARVVETEIDFS